MHPNFPSYVCRLTKALYDLKQAPHALFSRLSSKLLELGFVASQSDSSLFIFYKSSVVIYFLVYVNDVIAIGSHPPFVANLIKTLSLSFPIKNLYSLHYFLGVEVQSLPNGLV